MNKILFILLAVIVSSCVGPHGAINPLPVVNSPDNSAEVVIVRNNNLAGAAVNYKVTLDAREIMGIGIGEHTRFKVDSGQHTIGVICNGGWAPGDHINEKSLYMGPASTNYFMARAGGVCAVIEILNEHEAIKYIKHDNFIELTPKNLTP